MGTTDSDLKGIEVSGPMQATTLAVDLGTNLSAAGVYGAATQVEALPGSSSAGMAALAGTPGILQDDGASLSQPASAFREQIMAEDRTEADGDESQVAQSPLDALRKRLNSVKETRKKFEQPDADTSHP